MRCNLLLIPVLILILVSPLFFSGCSKSIRDIRDKMETGKRLRTEMETISEEPDNKSVTQNDESETSSFISDKKVTGEVFTDIFDMLDYEEVSFVLSEDETKIIISNKNLINTPLKNSYEIFGASLPAGTEEFRITYDPKTNSAIEYEIR